jgi:exoribonuclease-2
MQTVGPLVLCITDSTKSLTCALLTNRSQTSFIGIVLATAIAANRIRFMIMDSSGQVVPCSEEDVQFVFRPNSSKPVSKKGKERETVGPDEIDMQVPLDVVERAFSLDAMFPIETTDTSEKEEIRLVMVKRSEARRILSRKLRKIQIAAERQTGRLLRDRSGCFQPESLWEEAHAENVHLADRNIWPALTCEDVLTKRFGGSQDEMARFALHTILMSRPDLFQADESDMKISGKFAARPGWMVDDLEAGKKAFQAWETAPDSDAAAEVREFIEKCREIVLVRRESDNQDPQPDPTLSQSGKRLLRLFKQRILEQRTIQKSPYWSFVPAILGATNLYKVDLLDMGTLMRFLWEMGEIGNSGNITAFKLKDLEDKEGDLRLRPSGSYTAPVHTSSADSLEAQLNFPDTHESLRHDFGSLPVYVIDSADAKELDDGISLERIPGSSDRWIHVHIADPTRWLAPEDDITSRAMRHGSTFYAAGDGARPMMPNELVMSAMSLGAKRDQRAPQVVLTFSAKVTENGELLDYQIRAGMVKNVKTTTYSSVDDVLQGGSQAPGLDDACSQDLRDLHSLAQTVRRRRLAHSGLEWFVSEAEVAVARSGETTNVEWQMPDHPHAPSRILVSECMILAGQVAGKFASERDLTLPYRGSNVPYIPQRGLPEGWTSEMVIQDLLNKRDPVTLATSQLDVARLGMFVRGAPPSPRPIDHWILGISAQHGGYSRVTSPLRRFSDMIGHWQIKQALLPLAGKPLFDEAHMERLCVYTNKADRRIRRLDLASRGFWKALAVKRALDQGGIMANGVNLHDVTGIVTAVTDYSAIRKRRSTSLYVPDLALRVHLSQGDVVLDGGLRRWEIGQPVRARIHEAILWPTPFINAEPLEN